MLPRGVTFSLALLYFIILSLFIIIMINQIMPERRTGKTFSLFFLTF